MDKMDFKKVNVYELVKAIKAERSNSLSEKFNDENLIFITSKIMEVLQELYDKNIVSFSDDMKIIYHLKNEPENYLLVKNSYSKMVELIKSSSNTIVETV